MLNGEETVAIRLRTLRQRRGMSQNALAQRSTVSSSTISRIEAGEIVSPGVDVLVRLSEALRVDLSEITGTRPIPRRRVEVSEGVAKVPLMRLRVQADGDPTWSDTAENIPLSLSAAVGRPNAFAAIVTGECMAPYVLPGETVLIDPDRLPHDRQMVVVTTEDGATMVKWYRVDADRKPYLRAADGTEIRPNGARLQGVVFRRESDPTPDPEP